MGGLKKVNFRFFSFWPLWLLFLMNIHCFKHTLSDFLNADGPPPPPKEDEVPPEDGDTPPAVPQSFKAVASGKQVTLTWATEEGVTYDIFFSTTAGFELEDGMKISNVMSPHTHTGLMDNTTYYYLLTAVNNSVTSEPAAEVSARTLPGTPEGFAATASQRLVTLNWTTKENVTYNIFFSTTTGFDIESTDAMKIEDVKPPHEHRGREDNTTYYYILTAVNPSGVSEPAAEVSALTPPGTPQNFTATASHGLVRLTWSVETGVTYKLFFATTSGFALGNDTEIPDVVTPPYEHLGRGDDTTYYYRLTAVNSSGESEPTDEKSALTPPAAPQNFIAMPSDRQITLTWNSRDGITYTLFYSTTASVDVESSATMRFSDIKPPYLHRGLMIDTTYYYRLTASSTLGGASEPTEEISATTPQVQVSAGGSHTCARASGRALCWGEGTKGRLGHNEMGSETATKGTPTQVYGLTSGVTHISAGLESAGEDGHTCAVVDGAALCWGEGGEGQLGNGGNSDEVSPQEVNDLTSGVTQISAGGFHTCAVMNGRAFCWGDGASGVLGRGNETDSNTPVQVDDLTSGVVTQISAGIAHTCAVMDGGAFCWGDGPPGKLGHNEGNGTGSKSRPTQVYSLTSGVTQISVSAGVERNVHTCAVMDGGAFCWGEGGNGQLGNGSNSDAVSPQEVRGLTSGVTQISAGGSHTCAVMNGGAFCWGAGNNGRLGDNTTGTGHSENTPQQVIGLTTGVTQISAGDSHTCAVVNDSVKCWGNSDNSRLGDGQPAGDGRTDSLTPTAVSDL